LVYFKKSGRVNFMKKKIYITLFLTGVIVFFGLYASGLINDKKEEERSNFYKNIGNNSQAELKISGMTCGSCVEKIENALMKVKGVNSTKVSLAKQKATVLFDPEITSASLLVNAINKLGKYKGTLANIKNSNELLKEEKERIEKAKLFAMSINGKEISNKDFETVLGKQLKNFKKVGKDYYPTMRQREQIIAEVADSMIDEAIIQNEIGKENFSVTDPEINAEIDKIKTNYKLDDKTLKENLRAQGLDINGFKEEIRKGLKVNKYLEAKVFPPRTPESKKGFLYQQWISGLYDQAEVRIYSDEILKAVDSSNTASGGCGSGGGCCSKRG